MANWQIAALVIAGVIILPLLLYFNWRGKLFEEAEEAIRRMRKAEAITKARREEDERKRKRRQGL